MMRAAVELCEAKKALSMQTSQILCLKLNAREVKLPMPTSTWVQVSQFDITNYQVILTKVKHHGGPRAFQDLLLLLSESL